MKLITNAMNKFGHLFYKVGQGFLRVLKLLPGFKKLSLRNQQISAIILLALLFVAIGVILSPYLSHRTTLSALESPVELNLADYQKNTVLQAMNDVYSFEGNSDQAVIGKIKDVDRLSSRYPFLKKARNGEYLLIMPDFVLLYDLENRQIMDVARVNMLDLKASEE